MCACWPRYHRCRSSHALAPCAPPPAGHRPHPSSSLRHLLRLLWLGVIFSGAALATGLVRRRGRSWPAGRRVWALILVGLGVILCTHGVGVVPFQTLTTRTGGGGVPLAALSAGILAAQP